MAETAQKPEEETTADASPDGEAAAGTATPSESSKKKQEDSTAKPKRRRRWLRMLGTLALSLTIILVAARLAAPTFIRWYVNDTIDKNPLYDGKIGDITLHLWRGAYSIEEIRLIKTTGNVPVPLFAAKRVDLAIEWDALMEGKLVGVIVIDKPELNFVDSDEKGEDQTGAGGPWLGMIEELFPFKINSARINDGTVHFRAFHSDPPVDVYLSGLHATLENLTNIHDETAPMISTVTASAMAMDSGKLDYKMKFDPTSYRPSFDMAVKLVGLDVTRTNALARAYGNFDFEKGWFDLVVEMKAREGGVEGYVQPLFRNLVVFSPNKDIKEDNVLEVFWEALVGGTSQLFKNQSRQQLGTRIPLKGDLTNPKTDLFATIGNLLHNAFVRAYLPRLRGSTTASEDLTFGTGSVTDADAPGMGP